MEAVKTMIHNQDLPVHLWVEAVRIAIYVQNRLSHSDLELKTPEEVYTRKKPEVIHLKIFCCPVYVHISKENRTKLDPFGKKEIFLEYCEFSKAFRIYSLGFHYINTSRDLTIDEEASLKKSRRCQLEEIHEDDVPPRRTEAEPTPKIVPSEKHDMLEPQDPPTMYISRKRKPSWVREIIQEVKKYGAPKGSTRTSKRSSYVALMCDLVDQETTNNEESVLKKEWVESMMEEY